MAAAFLSLMLTVTRAAGEVRRYLPYVSEREWKGCVFPRPATRARGTCNHACNPSIPFLRHEVLRIAKLMGKSCRSKCSPPPRASVNHVLLDRHVSALADFGENITSQKVLHSSIRIWYQERQENRPRLGSFVHSFDVMGNACPDLITY